MSLASRDVAWQRVSREGACCWFRPPHVAKPFYSTSSLERPVNVLGLCATFSLRSLATPQLDRVHPFPSPVANGFVQGGPLVV